MKVVVDKELCIGCGLCVSMCDEIFELDEDGKSVVIMDEVSAEDEDIAMDAAEACPVDAIECGD